MKDKIESPVIWRVLSVLTVFVLLLLLVAYSKDVKAEGPEFQVDTERTVTWRAVADREDGRPVSGPVTYSVYHGTSDADMTLVREGVTGTTATGIPTVEGQNYVGVVAVEAGNTAGPSPMSDLFPFEGIIPDSRPSRPQVLSVE